MSEPGADIAARALAAAYCQRHGIECIRLAPGFNSATQQRICTVKLRFAAADGRPAYVATFAIEGDGARIAELVTTVHASGDIEPATQDDGRGSPTAAIASFLHQIESRVSKIGQEQAIQGIRFLGSSFLLHGTILFTVVSDEDGRLGIEIHKGSDRQHASLMAGNLLDGLYDGSIQRVPRSAG